MSVLVTGKEPPKAGSIDGSDCNAMEATVTINGTTLSNAQVMAMRVAVTRIATKIAMRVNPGILDRAYLAKLKEIEMMLLQNNNTNVSRNPDKS